VYSSASCVGCLRDGRGRASNDASTRRRPLGANLIGARSFVSRFAPVRDLLFSAKHLFVHYHGGDWPCRGLKNEQDRRQLRPALRARQRQRPQPAVPGERRQDGHAVDGPVRGAGEEVVIVPAACVERLRFNSI
jgi:hypothetical protein